MRMTAVVAAIASCTVIIAAHSASADALSPVEIAFEQQTPTLIEDIAQKTEQIKKENEKNSQNEEVQVEPVKHTVETGETLTSIAKQYETTWQRLFYKNVDLENPDQLNVGVVVTIPQDDEELEEREIPIVTEVSVQPSRQSSSTTTRSTVQSSASTASTPRGSTAGNGYVYGYCTWYVKNRRPNLPNNLGNANTWASRAAAQGFRTGSVPAVGAVAQAITGYMHVAYVEAVHSDGTITVSEMNFKGWGVQSSRVASASNFTYIY